MVHFLLPLSDPKALSFSGLSALSVLISRFPRYHTLGSIDEWIECVKVLAPSSSSIVNGNGHNALMEAASGGHVAHLAHSQFLLDVFQILAPNFDWDARDHQGMTACALAFQSGQPLHALAIFRAF